MKQRAYDITRDYKATGNKAVDGVASCIMWHRERSIALKAIHLKPLLYDQFKIYVEKVLLGKELEDEQPLSMDGVEIEQGSWLQRLAILPERWPIIAQA
ncbi:MAG: hypothetical protein ACTHMC_01505 [Pseudobacter sp.]|uniref:hypothetical protein n=1 Tax=Pseudobacter sp. TaxID=2045420 RepID=UPI003F7E14ED